MKISHKVALKIRGDDALKELFLKAEPETEITGGIFVTFDSKPPISEVVAEARTAFAKIEGLKVRKIDASMGSAVLGGNAKALLDVLELDCVKIASGCLTGPLKIDERNYRPDVMN